MEKSFENILSIQKIVVPLQQKTTTTKTTTIMEKEPKYFYWYYRVEFTYGDVIYTKGWGRNKKSAIMGIYRSFTHIWSVREVKESTWKRHQND